MPFRDTLEAEPYENVYWPGARKRANVPLTAWEAELRLIPDSAPYKERILRYVVNLHKHEAAGRGLILHGAHGTGKTCIAGQLLKEAMSRGACRCYFVDASDIPRIAIDRPTTDDGEPILPLLRGQAQLVVIDDLGSESEKASFWDDRSFRDILRARSNEKLVTWITANLELPELIVRVPALAKLMKGHYTAIEVSEPTWRPEVEI